MPDIIRAPKISEAEGEQCLTAQSAVTDALEVRAGDWQCMVAAGWITPADAYDKVATGLSPSRRTGSREAHPSPLIVFGRLSRPESRRSRAIVQADPCSVLGEAQSGVEPIRGLAAA